jgi:hypothetical protein
VRLTIFAVLAMGAPKGNASLFSEPMEDFHSNMAAQGWSGLIHSDTLTARDED